MAGYRSIEPDVGTQVRRVRDLERTVEDLRRERRTAATTISDGNLTVEGGGGVVVQDGGSIDIYGDGAVKVWGDTSLGTMTDGTFGIATIGPGGEFTTPSTVAQPDGFLCDAGPGLGYAVFRVDAATGKAVVSSSRGEVMLSYSTTSGSANARILLDGTIQMSTSSRRYKQDIEDHFIDPQVARLLRPRSWRDRREVAADPDTQVRYVGYIAEELHDLGLTEFVVYNEAGEPDAIAYDRLCVATLAVAVDALDRVEAAEAHIADLAARLDALEALAPTDIKEP